MLPSRSFGSFFHLVSSAHFIIVEWCWRICSRSHFDISLAFWLWASVVTHFPRQPTLRQTCVWEYPWHQYLEGVKEAGLGRGRSWIAFQLPRKLQWPWELWSWDRLWTCPELSLRPQPLSPMSFSHWICGALRKGCDLGWGSPFHPGANPTEGISWVFSAMNSSKSLGSGCFHRGGAEMGSLSRLLLSMLFLCVPAPPCVHRRGGRYHHLFNTLSIPSPYVSLVTLQDRYFIQHEAH